MLLFKKSFLSIISAISSIACLSNSVSMEAPDSRDTAQTLRISYFCPEMTHHQKDVSQVWVVLPDGTTTLKTLNWQQGKRHSFFKNGSEYPTFTLSSEALKSENPLTITVIYFTGYMTSRGSLITFDPITLNLDREKLKAGAKAVRITHAANSIENMELKYGYDS